MSRNQPRRKRRPLLERKVPNATTQKAMAELEKGEGKSVRSVDALMAELDADD